jgi:1,4-dihydroxy-2-naphthoate octaprenyltransferase
MSALLTCLPVLFALHNHLLVKGLGRFVADETKGKLTFVRLIGRHDGVFLFVVYSLFSTLFTLVDACAKPEIRLAANGWYLLYALYAFGKLMEHKQSPWL